MITDLFACTRAACSVAMRNLTLLFEAYLTLLVLGYV